MLLLTGFLGTAPAVIAAPWSKFIAGRPWLSRGQGGEETREGSQQHQHQKQQVLLPVSPLSEPQADRSPSPLQDNGNEQQSKNTLPERLHKYTPGFVAFGDSYSAGIGTTIPAGTTENACRQGTGAYPFLIHSDFSNHFSSKYTNSTSHHGHNTTEASSSLQWLSCTGSTTDDVLSSPDGPGGAAGNGSQIDMFNYTSTSPRGGAARFATLSIGGNDVGFFDVINACVFRFYAFYSGTCDEALTRSEKLIAAALEYMRRKKNWPSSFLSQQVKVGDEEMNDDSGDDDKDEDKDLTKEARLLTHKITLIMLEILDKIHWERHPDFRIILTGYAQFFNAETVPCDEVTLGVWWDSISATVPRNGRILNGEDGPVENEGLSSYRPKLKREVRKRMNILVEGVNQLLGEIVDGVNARFTPPSRSSSTRDSDNTGAGASKQSEERPFQKTKTKKKVIFVNYDHLFEGHRFCEEGVEEPDFERTGSWFFLPGGGDNLPLEPTPNPPSSTPGSGSGDGEAEGRRNQHSVDERERHILSKEDFHLVNPDTCLEGIITQAMDDKSVREKGDWGRKILCYMAIVKKRNPHLVLDPRYAPEPVSVMEANTPRPLNRDSMWYVPTYYGKTFHPVS